MRKLAIFLARLLLICRVCEPKAIYANPGNCGPNSYTILGNGTICVPCPACPVGFGLSIPCGSLMKTGEIGQCRHCSKGTFSDSHSSSSCKRCKKCKRRSIVRRKCTPTTDTKCAPRKLRCKPDFYFSEIVLDCLPCSRCCDDGKDIKIQECVKQGSQSENFCSVHSFHRCSKDDKNDDKNETQSVEKRISNDIPFIHNTTTPISPVNDTSGTSNRANRKNERNSFRKKTIARKWMLLCIPISVISTVIIITLVFIVKCTKKNSSVQCFPPMRLSKRKNIAARCKSDQSDELEDFSNNDVISGTYSFETCGVFIKYDPDCKQDRYKNLIVETLICQDLDNYFKNIEPGQMFLSPIYRFYSKGEKFENEVKISLPHSALWTQGQKNWDIEVLCMDERKGKEANWEKITDSLEVNWKDVSFKTDTLLTYAVVGKPLKEAKKRMQFVLFTTSEMISDQFEACIYLLDDNESSYQNVLKENSLKGLTMLGSFYAAFVDCYSSVDINLNVEGLLDGWELHRLTPETVSSFICKESYFSIPSFQAMFRRVKRRADKFSCKFRINFAESEIIIPAFTFVPEEEFCVVVDVHNQDHDTSVIKEKKTLFKDLHYDTFYVLGRMLDVSVKGQGTWRHLARHFGLTGDKVEQFSVEYRTLEGSPSRALFEYLNKVQPNITVGEFAKCLESLGREDVMAVLYKHLKTKKPQNTEV